MSTSDPPPLPLDELFIAIWANLNKYLLKKEKMSTKICGFWKNQYHMDF